MTAHATLVDVFEDVLEVPFEARYLKPLDRAKARELALGVRQFYESFTIPDKDRSELRPYLSPRFASTSSLGTDYYNSPDLFKDGEFNFDSSKVREIAPQIKTYLLYCHSVCMYDALPALLDYFRFPDGTVSDRRLPAIDFLLQQYAGVAALLRHSILIPLSEGVRGASANRIFYLEDYEERAVVSQFARHEADLRSDVSTAGARILGALIKEHCWLREQCGGKFDLYFPHRAYVPAYLGLLRTFEAKFSSATILEPFNVGILGSLSRIDPQKLSMRDIIEIRKDGAFDEFRSFLRRVFDRLNKSDQNFSDFDTEFAQAVREEMEANKDRIKILTEKSNVLRDAFSQMDRILVGAATGAIGGALAGSPELAVIGAALGGGFRPLYDILRGTATRPSRLSMRNHFLALDPSRDASTRSAIAVERRIHALPRALRYRTPSPIPRDSSPLSGF